MIKSLEEKVSFIISWLEEKKASNILSIDVRDKCSFTEYLIICVGSATLHNKAIADFVFDKAKETKMQILGKEGLEALTWVLIDLNDIIVHIFTAETLAMYNIEDLWTKRSIQQDINNEN